MTKGQILRYVVDAGFCITGDMHQQKVPFEGTWEYATISENFLGISPDRTYVKYTEITHWGYNNFNF